jgi:hypothetical protein
MSLCAAVFSVASCTHTTDRVIEPAGADDASTTVPEATDASLSPIGPVARSHPPAREPPPDFSLVRSPELGLALPTRHELALVLHAEQAVPATGGSAGVGGAAGFGGSDRRPVSSGGGRYF